MKKTFLVTVLALIFISGIYLPVRAADTNYVTPVFPVRGRQFWRQGGDISNFLSLQKIVDDSGLPATWLVQYDTLFDNDITGNLQKYSTSSSEIGIFLEVTRKLAEDSFVSYDWQTAPWSAADKIFLSGYSRSERQRLIDKSFSAFKSKFGYYPATYGAWYIDVWSMEYIRDKYGAKTVLGLSDQYSTDGYQTWGQYLDLPYIVSKNSAIEPAGDQTDSTGVVKLQWAPREPLLGIGNSVNASNYSVQVNDYVRGKNLGIDYFNNLLAVITLDVPGHISQAVIGMEAGELEQKYYPQLIDQLNTLRNLQQAGRLTVTTAGSFGNIYLKANPDISPPAVLESEDNNQSGWWYMDKNFRVGISLENNHLYINDLRYYHSSPYRDNDQIIKDPRENLVRVVPAAIDEVSLSNRLDLGAVKDLKMTKTTNSLSFSWTGLSLTASASGLILPISLRSELDKRQIAYTVQNGGLKINAPEVSVIKKDFCHDEYGNYAGRWPCLKKLIFGILTKIPDLVYSRLNGQTLLGLRTGFTAFWGLRFPQIYLGKLNFEFPVLDNFISLKKKLAPAFAWQGRQEYEAVNYLKLGTLYEKGKIYGQDEIIKAPPGKKIFENGFYAVYTSTY
jgi:hypothetical protein